MNAITPIKSRKIIDQLTEKIPRNILAIWQESNGDWHWDFTFDDKITTGGAVGMMEVAKHYIIANSVEKP